MRKAKRQAERKAIKANPELIEKYVETGKYVELAETILRTKMDAAVKELTRQQTIHELRVSGAVNAAWMLALKDVMGYGAVRINRVYARVLEFLQALNESKRGEKKVEDIIEIVNDELNIEVNVPEGIHDHRPLLIGGRAISYGPMLATVRIGGYEAQMEANDNEQETETA